MEHSPCTGVKPGQLEKRREKAWVLSKCRAAEEMRNIKWMDRITNDEVLGRIEEKRTLWKSLKKRRGQRCDGAHTETRGIAQRYLGRGGGKEKGKGKAQIKIFRPNNC